MAETSAFGLFHPNAAEYLRLQLNKELVAAAEPILQEHLQIAVAALEKVMRERMGALLIGLLEQNFRMYEDRNELHLVLHQALPTKGDPR